MCIRDETGSFVLAKTEWFSPIREVYIREALGLLSALEWVRELQLGHVDFEMDAKKVVDTLMSSKYDVSEFDTIIQNCKSLFRHYDENSNVEFVRRLANEIVHELAKTVILSASFQVWVAITDCIEHILSNEI